MAIHLIVDGYNLMGASRGGRLDPMEDLERSRERLLDELLRFRARRPIKITVVFDGLGEGRASGFWRGIRVVFAGGEGRADGAIAHMARSNPQGAVVATSDRALADMCRRLGATVLSSQELRLRLLGAGALQGSLQWDEEEDEEITERQMRKKGPSRRLSKRERRDRQRLRKL